jgi:hypothetical protein
MATSAAWLIYLVTFVEGVPCTVNHQTPRPKDRRQGHTLYRQSLRDAIYIVPVSIGQLRQRALWRGAEISAVTAAVQAMCATPGTHTSSTCAVNR